MTVSNNKELLLEVNHLGVSFKIKNDKSLFFAKPQTLKAVKDVSFKLYAGETLGVVGESGCGKSTLARAIIGLVEASEGEILWLGKNLRKQSPKQWKETRKDIQMIFQDPLASLNPRMNIGEIIAEPLKIYQPHLSAAEVKEKVQAMMLKVGLLPNLINRYPHEFSGGQRQRLCIARALEVMPEVLICDEPVSALDVSIQAQVLNLMKDIQKEMNLTYLFIAHDLSVVQYMSDRVMVMYLGSIVEVADSRTLYEETLHPYTKALLSAIPIADIHVKKKRQILEGEVPSPIHKPTGCPFHNRCPQCMEICKKERPVLAEKGKNGHMVACHLYDGK